MIFDFLFLNDVFENTSKQGATNIDRMLKMIAVAEIYSLQDIGLDILFANRERLGGRLDVEQGADWLIRDRAKSTLTYRRYLAAENSSADVETQLHVTDSKLALDAILKSRSWRMTAPLRKVAVWLRNRRY